jgi:hypothetical protein
MVCLAAWLVLSSLGCHKKVKAEFERPPAASTVPEAEPVPEEPEATEAPVIVAEPPDEEPVPEEVEPPPRPVRRRRPPDPPPPPPAPEEPPSPRLTTEPNNAETGIIRDKLALTEAILSTLEPGSLTVKQREQAAAARAFVTQARKALEEGDYRRALVLADKGLILAEDVRDASIG